MTAHDFVKKYMMHDSLIDTIEVLDEGTRIVLSIDFAFWMQPSYNEKDPETGPLIVEFYDVSRFCIPENVNWDEISILETTVLGETVVFKLMNDMTDAYLELEICSEDIKVSQILR